MEQIVYKIKLAKFLMKRFEIFPVSPEIEITTLQEIFNHPVFLDGSEVERKEIMHKSSERSYYDEINYPWDNYFGIDLFPFLNGKSVLDLGSFNGGRSIAWFKRYAFSNLVGVDVRQEYIDTARLFAAHKEVGAIFKFAPAESLPFDDNSFDAALSFEVFEHIRDVRKTLDECNRVLKVGGRLFVVFPGYYQPTAHHLSLVTNVPLINCLFSGKILIQAYYDILEERGVEASWYRRDSPNLKPWEMSNTINGTTLSEFHKLIRKGNWNIILHSRLPFGSIGRNASKNKLYKFASKLLYPLSAIPMINEITLHRITYILEKRNNNFGSKHSHN